MRKGIILSTLAVVLSLVLAGCDLSQTAPTAQTTGETKPQTMTKVSLQLKWVPQAQFAGYYVAKSKGFYKDEGLDVDIKPGGPSIAPESLVAAGGADFGVDWLPSLLAARDKGVPIVNMAQIFQKSAMLEISFKTANINKPSDLKGKNVGVWLGGNEYELYALLDKNGLDRQKDLQIVSEPFEMTPFLNKQMDAAAAMTYNELPMVYEAGVKPEQLNVINMEDEGVGMLEDDLFTTEKMLKENKDLSIRFLRASLKGWKYSVEHPEEAVDIVLSYDTSKTQTKLHQTTMMTEVAKLVSSGVAQTKGIGYLDPDAFNRTAQISYKYGIIAKPAGSEAYTHDIWTEAVKGL